MATAVLLVYFVTVLAILLTEVNLTRLSETPMISFRVIFPAHDKSILFSICSRTTTAILSWIPPSCSNSSSRTSQLWSCSPTPTRRATSCSGQCVCMIWICLAFHLLPWQCLHIQIHISVLQCYFKPRSVSLNFI